MFFTAAPTRVDVFTALRSFLLAVLPAGIEVVRAQVNRVPQPPGTDYVVMTPISTTRLTTNVDVWADRITGGTSSGGVTAVQSGQVVIQCDVFGPNSADNAATVTTLLRGLWSTDWFAANAPAGITPLFADDPRQIVFQDGEQQSEDRWSIDVNLQVDQTVTTPQDFADVVTVNIRAPADAG